MIRDTDRNLPPADSNQESDALPAKDGFIQRIDQARGVIALAIYALAFDHGHYSALAASALDLANDELQRLRDDIDASWATEQGLEVRI